MLTFIGPNFSSALERIFFRSSKECSISAFWCLIYIIKSEHSSLWWALMWKTKLEDLTFSAFSLETLKRFNSAWQTLIFFSCKIKKHTLIKFLKLIYNWNKDLPALFGSLELHPVPWHSEKNRKDCQSVPSPPLLLAKA